MPRRRSPEEQLQAMQLDLQRANSKQSKAGSSCRAQRQPDVSPDAVVITKAGVTQANGVYARRNLPSYSGPQPT